MAQFILPDRTRTKEMRYQMGYALADLAQEYPKSSPSTGTFEAQRASTSSSTCIRRKLVKCGIAEQNLHRDVRRAVPGGLHPLPVHVRCVQPAVPRPTVCDRRVQQPQRQGPRRLRRPVHWQGRGDAPERQGAWDPPACAAASRLSSQAATSRCARPCAWRSRRRDPSTSGSSAARSRRTRSTTATNSSWAPVSRCRTAARTSGSSRPGSCSTPPAWRPRSSVRRVRGPPRPPPEPQAVRSGSALRPGGAGLGAGHAGESLHERGTPFAGRGGARRTRHRRSRGRNWHRPGGLHPHRPRQRSALALPDVIGRRR